MHVPHTIASLSTCLLSLSLSLSALKIPQVLEIVLWVHLRSFSITISPASWTLTPDVCSFSFHPSSFLFLSSAPPMPSIHTLTGLLFISPPNYIHSPSPRKHIQRQSRNVSDAPHHCHLFQLRRVAPRFHIRMRRCSVRWFPFRYLSEEVNSLLITETTHRVEKMRKKI